MKKLNLLDPEIVRLINKLSDNILEVIDNQDDFTRSDLQGVIQAIVVNILNKGINLEVKS